MKNLKLLDLSFSLGLIDVLELSRDINLTCIRLSGCARLRSFPSGIGWRSLEILDLSSCSLLETFSEIPRNIKYLNLGGTAIKQLPLSIESSFKLENLSLKDCIWLRSLPHGIWKLKSLLSLNLGNCSISHIIPEILDSMDHSSSLGIPNFQELSSPAENQNSPNRCHDLSKLPPDLCDLSFIEELNMTSCSFKTIPSRIKLLSRLRKLNINSCRELQLLPDLPLSLEALHLRFNQFETLPSSIKQLSRLTHLDIVGCYRLKSLPNLPHSLQRIDAYGCTMLVIVPGLVNLFELKHEDSPNEKIFIFSDCHQLDPKAWTAFLTDAKLVIQNSAMQWYRHKTRNQNKSDRTMILHLGSEKRSGWHIKARNARLISQWKHILMIACS